MLCRQQHGSNLLLDIWRRQPVSSERPPTGLLAISHQRSRSRLEALAGLILCQCPLQGPALQQLLCRGRGAVAFWGSANELQRRKSHYCSALSFPKLTVSHAQTPGTPLHLHVTACRHTKSLSMAAPGTPSHTLHKTPCTCEADASSLDFGGNKPAPEGVRSEAP